MHVYIHINIYLHIYIYVCIYMFAIPFLFFIFHTLLLPEGPRPPPPPRVFLHFSSSPCICACPQNKHTQTHTHVHTYTHTRASCATQARQRWWAPAIWDPVFRDARLTGSYVLAVLGFPKRHPRLILLTPAEPINTPRNRKQWCACRYSDMYDISEGYQHSECVRYDGWVCEVWWCSQWVCEVAPSYLTHSPVIPHTLTALRYRRILWYTDTHALWFGGGVGVQIHVYVCMCIDDRERERERHACV